MELSIRKSRWRLGLFAAAVVTAMALAIATASASTIGEVAPAGPTSGCTACSLVQKSTHVGAATYTFPTNGIVTSFAVQVGSVVQPGDFVRMFAFEQISPSIYSARADSGPQNIPASAAGQVMSFPTRLTVNQGQLLGMEVNSTGSGNTAGTFIGTGFDSTDAVDTFASPPTLNVDTSATGPSQSHLNIEATLEPDADGDGYGDLTQDFCSTDPAIQTACPLAPDTAPPVISQFKALYKGFRVRPKGAVISKRAHPGTTISLNLSERATVNFAVAKAFRGKITKGVCKKAGRTNRKGRRCTKIIAVHQFARSMTTGVNAFNYSGRYLDAKGRVGTLRQGPYRMTATPVDAVGNVGKPDIVNFRVRR